MILAEIPVADSGQASGLQSTFRQLGSALGVAIGHPADRHPGPRQPGKLTEADARAGQEQVTEVVTSSAGAVIPSLQATRRLPTAGDAAAAGMIHASKVTTGVAAAIIGLGLAATWALPPTPPAPADPNPGPDTTARPTRRLRRQGA